MTQSLNFPDLAPLVSNEDFNDASVLGFEEKMSRAVAAPGIAEYSRLTNNVTVLPKLLFEDLATDSEAKSTIIQSTTNVMLEVVSQKPAQQDQVLRGELREILINLMESHQFAEKLLLALAKNGFSSTIDRCLTNLCEQLSTRVFTAPGPYGAGKMTFVKNGDALLAPYSLDCPLFSAEPIEVPAAQVFKFIRQSAKQQAIPEGDEPDVAEPEDKPVQEEAVANEVAQSGSADSTVKS